MSEIRDQVLAHFGIDASDVEIKHYGTKGMKWGIRKDKRARSVSADHIESRVSKKKKQSEMSTAELKRLNDRLQTERTNKELQSRGTLQKIKAGTAMAGTILAVGTTITTAYNFSQSPAGKAIAAQIMNAANTIKK